jgi:glucose/arabinose dehydrogenase
VAPALLAAGVLAASASPGSSASPQFRPFARGFDSPVAVTWAPGEPRRLYVVEQAGRIIQVEGARRRVFLDIRSLVGSGGERGLLSVAFHPKYRQNHRFYVNYTNTDGDTRIVEYRSNGTTGLRGSARVLFGVGQPYPNHNGGQVQFGPDGVLYIGMGDGGAGGDPENRAQDPDSLLGKMLAYDVDAAGARPRIVAYGVRNPWRFTFDRLTGDFYTGDVGQGDWEEIDYLPKGVFGKTIVNFGWSRYEGRVSYDPSRAFQSQYRLVMPVAVYSHSLGCSVTGGYVYRGKVAPSLRGRYVYGDYCTGYLWSLKASGSKASVRREPGQLRGLTSFGEDAAGELYAVAEGGVLYRLAAR